ncbi:hypothetical protein B0H13DRAFT_2377972 [Mycena leptocephala]|nr:hypothetical protein B0H13DRAFT_2377972 [Mycena leptocephala]
MPEASPRLGHVPECSYPNNTIPLPFIHRASEIRTFTSLFSPPLPLHIPSFDAFTHLLAQSLFNFLSIPSSIVHASSSASASIKSADATSSSHSTASSSASIAHSPPVGFTPVGDLGGPAALYQPALSVPFHVQNTGSLAGNEVSQLYLGFPAGDGEPPKVLRGFARTFLGRGQSQTVTIPLRLKDVRVGRGEPGVDRAEGNGHGVLGVFVQGYSFAGDAHAVRMGTAEVFVAHIRLSLVSNINVFPFGFVVFTHIKKDSARICLSAWRFPAKDVAVRFKDSSDTVARPPPAPCLPSKTLSSFVTLITLSVGAIGAASISAADNGKTLGGNYALLEYF